MMAETMGEPVNMVITVPAMTAWIRAAAERVHAEADELTALDAAIGDGDHGINLDRGLQAVCAVLAERDVADVAELAKTVGMTLVSTVGGASGALYGTFFLRFATGLAQPCTAQAFGAALERGVEGLQARGRAEVGDKTMLDAWVPALAAYQSAVVDGAGLPRALRAMAEAAASGRDATTPLVARKGRASYLGERSAGHLDPGAASTAILLAAAADILPGDANPPA